MDVLVFKHTQACVAIDCFCHAVRVSGISGMEWWNGMLEWNTRMEYWNKRSITQYIKQDKHMYQHAYHSIVVPLELCTILSDYNNQLVADA